MRSCDVSVYDVMVMEIPVPIVGCKSRITIQILNSQLAKTTVETTNIFPPYKLFSIVGLLCTLVTWHCHKIKRAVKNSLIIRVEGNCIFQIRFSNESSSYKEN